MAGSRKYFVSPLVLLALLIMASLDFTVAQVGVNYGMLGTGLPSPADTVALFKQNNIRRMRLYDPNDATLQALGGSDIELTISVPNRNLQSVAASQEESNTWVQNNIRNYPNVRFRYIVVGNEVSPVRGETAQYVPFVLPAMSNIYNAIQSAGLGNQIRVTTATETRLLEKSYPPADGVFRNDVTSYLNPIVNFLVNTRAPLFVTIYPYFSYIENQGIPDYLRYALFQSEGVVVPGGTRYQNLFYAMLDSMYAALDKVGGSPLDVVVAETGWPVAPGGEGAATPENARVYNTNLIQRVRDGTPMRPGRAIETYIFSMYDENQKNPESERNFGIFFADGRPKYPISF